MNNKENAPCIFISLGELADKITILRIKLSHSNPESIKYKNIKTELELLEDQLLKYNIDNNIILDLYFVNNLLWDLEDQIRTYELNNNFGELFVQAARSIYKSNDLRFKLKDKINKTYNSFICEEKILPEYNNEP